MPDTRIHLRESHAYGRFIAHCAEPAQTTVELAFYMGWVALGLNRYQTTDRGANPPGLTPRNPNQPEGESS